MSATIKTFMSVVLLTTTAACATQPTCTGEEMIAMRAGGFDQERIESMCMARRFDLTALQQTISTASDVLELMEQANRGH